jgi:3-oxoacyl-[acyl-carrier-protein] synthase II
MADRLLITGFGVISGIGLNVENTLKSLLNEQSGVGEIKYLQTTLRDFPVSEVQLSDRELFESNNIDKDKVITRTSLMGISAAREAIKMAGLNFDQNSRIGLISGTTVGGMEKSERFYSDFLANDSRNDYISAHDCGACTEAIADNCGTFKFVSTISTACSSAANSIIFGANMIRQGLLDCVVVGGAECLTKFHLNGFKTLMILDNQPCRPFDSSRAGLNLGEGAAYLVIESALKEKVQYWQWKRH